MKKINLNSRAITSEASKARLPYPMKQYSTEGANIPLQKNWSETWHTLPASFDNISEEILNMELRNDDVFGVTFMKCGSTWMQECAWLLLNNLDYDTSKLESLSKRSPLIEQFLWFQGNAAGVPGKNSSSPRLIKTHLPASLLPLQLWEKKPKTIYVARNAKDCVLSSYHFLRNMAMWRGDNLSDYVEDFLNNEITYTHFWTHIVDFWKMRNEPFIFFVTYEDMQRDLAGVIQRLCTFLERPQLEAKELEKLVDHLSFSSMKANESTNNTEVIKKSMPGVQDDFQFMRRGITGSFKDELSPELQEKINKWSKEFLAQHGLTEEDIFGQL